MFPSFKRLYGRYRLSFISNSRIIKKIATLLAIFALIFLLISYQRNEQRAELSAKVTKDISRVLGTRITAVRLLPDSNTTLMEPENSCREDDIFAVILVKSIPKAVDRRNQIRKTWKNFIFKAQKRVEVYFFIGLDSGNITKELQEEQSINNDLIVEDLEENYYLLAVKTLRMLKWFNKSCDKRAEYFIKTDDDMFLHIPNLISHIESVPNQWVNYIGGQIHLKDPVDHNPYSKWFAPAAWWDDAYYPPFVSGALTVINSDIVVPILRASLTVPLFHLEDVFLIGMVAFNQLNLMPNNIPRIESNSPEWIIRIKMTFSREDLAKTYIAFHCPNEPSLIEELYLRSVVGE